MSPSAAKEVVSSEVDGQKTSDGDGCATGSATGVADGKAGLEAALTKLQEMLVSVGRAIVRGDSGGALDLLAAVVSALPGSR